jgi:aminoglycoside 6'-N-acetyltransferase I
LIYDYTPQDRFACAALYVDVFINEPWQYSWMTEENTLRYFRDIENTPCFRGFVAKKDGAPVGFCFGVTNDCFLGRVYEIREFAVARSEQGSGTGTYLLANAEKRLQRLGVQTLTLATLRDAPAFDFYLKNGFEPSVNTVYLSKNIGND